MLQQKKKKPIFENMQVVLNLNVPKWKGEKQTIKKKQ